jgi:hypothetical protein
VGRGSHYRHRSVRHDPGHDKIEPAPPDEDFLYVWTFCTFSRATRTRAASRTDPRRACGLSGPNPARPTGLTVNPVVEPLQTPTSYDGNADGNRSERQRTGRDGCVGMTSTEATKCNRE